MKRANSIQFIPLNHSYPVEVLARDYFDWLPTLFSGLIRVKKAPDLSLVTICFLRLSLLELKRSNTAEGVYFSVVGGILSRREGIFSFEVKNGELITSLKDFLPRLPWPIYRMTQYPFHDLVMFLYSQHLRTFK